MPRTLDVDYLVVGAGAAGMAFTDALIDHADARVALVDRRPAPGGHWLDAYPFVRLHQASAFYGVASTLLGGGRLQTEGPEAGLQERADRDQICAYYASILEDRMDSSGKVEFFGNSDYLGDGRVVRDTGAGFVVPEHCRIVDAAYLAPEIPATSPPPFEVADDARVIPLNDLPGAQDAPSQYVIVGSGKTATDALVWLLGRGIAPDAICWVRPRDPWMFNRAKVQPDPAIFLGMVADTLEAATAADSLDDLFLRLEAAEIMLRIDRTVTPTMARTPTLAMWELELLRGIEHTSYAVGTCGGLSGEVWCLPMGLKHAVTTRSWCTARRTGCTTPHSCPSGALMRSGSSRPALVSHASARHLPGTSRRRATTMRRETGSAPRRRSRTRWPTGRT